MMKSGLGNHRCRRVAVRVDDQSGDAPADVDCIFASADMPCDVDSFHQQAKFARSALGSLAPASTASS